MAARPFALITFGASRPPSQAHAIRIEPTVGTLFKPLLLPGIAFCMGRLAGVVDLALAVAGITAAMPTGANAILLAHRDERLVETPIATVLVTTGSSMASLPVLAKVVL